MRRRQRDDTLNRGELLLRQLDPGPGAAVAGSTGPATATSADSGIGPARLVKMNRGTGRPPGR